MAPQAPVHVDLTSRRIAESVDPLMVYDAIFGGCQLAVAVVESRDGLRGVGPDGQRTLALLARHVRQHYWGSHERHFPADAMRHKSGRRAAIYLKRPGAGTRVRSWAPSAGAFHGFLITHSESISIADCLSLGEGNEPEYRPTVHYAYHPCDDAVLSMHELAGRNWQPQQRQRLIRDEIVAGHDELGVLLMGHARGSYWYGSQLGIDEARAACPHNSATSLQVTAAVMGGVVWALKNPQAGIVEPEELPFAEILALCRPYLGKVVGVYSDWSPLVDRCRLFDEDIDRADPWQFKNFRVV